MSNKIMINEAALAVLPELIRPLVENWKNNGVDHYEAHNCVKAALDIGDYFDRLRLDYKREYASDDAIESVKKLFEVSKRAMDAMTPKEKPLTVGDMIKDVVSVMRYMDGYFQAAMIVDSLDDDLAIEGLKEFVGMIFDKVLSDEQRKQVAKLVESELAKEAPAQ